MSIIFNDTTAPTPLQKEQRIMDRRTSNVTTLPRRHRRLPVRIMVPYRVLLPALVIGACAWGGALWWLIGLIREAV